MNRFASKAVVYADHVAAAPWTAPSVASLFTGYSPTVHGVHIGHWTNEGMGLSPAISKGAPGVVSGDVPTLAAVLRDSGYLTAFVGTSPFLTSSGGFDRGFQYFDDLVSPGSLTTLRFALDAPALKPYNASAMVDRFIRVIDAPRDRPLALIGHLFDPHQPYSPPPTYAPKNESPTLPEEYDGEVAYVDAQFGRLWDHLSATGRLGHTIVAFTADHGEAFERRTAQAPLGEPAPAADNPYYTRTGHGHTMFEELLHIPFILYGPAITPRIERHMTRTIDVFPTIVEALHVPRTVVVEGRSVLEPLVNDVPALSESIIFGLEKKSWREDNYKLVYRLGYPRGAESELYDLKRDPGERDNIAGVEPEVAREMGRHMEAYLASLVKWRGTLAQGRDGAPWIPMDPETADRLRALGYVQR